MQGGGAPLAVAAAASCECGPLQTLLCERTSYVCTADNGHWCCPRCAPKYVCTRHKRRCIPTHSLWSQTAGATASVCAFGCSGLCRGGGECRRVLENAEVHLQFGGSFRSHSAMLACIQRGAGAVIVPYPKAFVVHRLGLEHTAVEVLSAWLPRQSGRRLLMETTMEVRGKHLASGVLLTIRQDLIPSASAGQHRLGVCNVRQTGSAEAKRVVRMIWPHCCTTVLGLKLFDTSELSPCAVRRETGAVPTSDFNIVGTGPGGATPCYYTREITGGVRCGLCHARSPSLPLFAASSCCTAPPETNLQ
jgi:hypothetical protein